MRFHLSLVSTILSNFRFYRFSGDKTGSRRLEHMVPNIVIKKSTIAFLLNILWAILVNFRFSTGFSLIKPEVDTLRVWELDQTRVSRIFRVEWGVNDSCRTTSGFYRKWVIGPEIRHYFQNPNPKLHISWNFQVARSIFKKSPPTCADPTNKCRVFNPYCIKPTKSFRLTHKFYGLKTLKWVQNLFFFSWVKNTVRLSQIFKKPALNQVPKEWSKHQKPH